MPEIIWSDIKYVNKIRNNNAPNITNGSMSMIISKSEFEVSSTVTSSSLAINPTLYSLS